MKSNLIEKSVNLYKGQVEELIKNLHELTDEIDHKEMSKTISDLRNRMTEPFMFVIVGEVKAGKSSFINALLDTGVEICKVAASPMTDTIQQITYGPSEKTIEINPFLKRIFQPVDLLKDISIVDTPGTNTIVDHHQEITENFIPASDLIVFVFEAKNPYRQSSWDFFNYIHAEWRRKIVFVLQQKDLMNAEDLQTNISGVHKYAEDKGIKDPTVFAVSAKQELENQKDISGYIPLRKYISEHITGGRAPLLKIKNNVETSLNILERLQKGINDRRNQFESDREFRKSVHEALSTQQNQSHRQIDTLIENVIAGYSKITNQTYDELEGGLTFGSLLKRTFSGIVNKNKSAKIWFNEITTNLETKLNSEMKLKLDAGVNDLAESIQQMARIIDLKLQSSSTILKNDHEIFSDIAERRSNVLGDLRNTFNTFIQDTSNFSGDKYLEDYKSLNPNLATGGGMAIIGIILQSLSSAVVFDITGGILTAAGIVFAGVSIGWNRKKVLNGYKDVVQSGERKMNDILHQKLKSYTDDIREKFESNFDRFDQMLIDEKTQLEYLENKELNIKNQLIDIQSKLSSIVTS